jgi:hypothetical protein
MSLRANVFAINLKSLDSALGSGDAELAASWKEKVKECYRDEKYIAQSNQIIDYLIKTPRDKQTMRSENERVAIALHQLALLDPATEKAESSFFETLAARMVLPRHRIEWFANYRCWLLVGRPLVGDVLDSDWSDYAYLTTSEAAELLQHIEEDERVHCYFDAAAGRTWLKGVVERGLDLWIFFS